ncbi:dihydrofolate reductase family protein [uncultured Roseibium sp.]|uniref:dihydrofolate reductase family protein n=1 Tax=uncultured Roseibium sp. TaxID=1936171 RepID=UPI00262F0F3B|nr:dihydrofolate reductase family protein [uncultured Roseibium sp.]
MRKLAILTFVTMDGVMQSPSSPDEDRSGGFKAGGWAAPFWQDVMEQVQREAMNETYDMLFGRKTYQLFAGHWPEAEDSTPARIMNAARKYVATTTMDELTWSNSRKLNGDPVTAIRRLKASTGPLLQVHGSWQLIQLLARHDLIDEFRLWTFPVVAGSGKRLFQETGSLSGFTLKKLEATQSGVVMSIYER